MQFSDARGPKSNIQKHAHACTHTMHPLPMNLSYLHIHTLMIIIFTHTPSIYESNIFTHTHTSMTIIFTHTYSYNFTFFHLNLIHSAACLILTLKFRERGRTRTDNPLKKTSKQPISTRRNQHLSPLGKCRSEPSQAITKHPSRRLL